MKRTCSIISRGWGGSTRRSEFTACCLLELNQRLSLGGLAHDGVFAMPLTQEALADALGLTTVHINRMVQLARREGILSWEDGRVTLYNPALIAERIGWAPAQVSYETPV